MQGVDTVSHAVFAARDCVWPQWYPVLDQLTQLLSTVGDSSTSGEAYLPAISLK
eukprot:COSAG02_NODE_532_length_20668_cov_28.281832_6_plen_54_part_00